MNSCLTSNSKPEVLLPKLKNYNDIIKEKKDVCFLIHF